MYQAFSTTAAAPSVSPEHGEDPDPDERPAAKIIPFNSHGRQQSAPDASLNEIVYFPLTVDENLSADAQNIVKRTCGENILSLKEEHLLTKHQSKIWIRMQAVAFGIALHAIMLGLPGAELGRVVHIPAI